MTDQLVTIARFPSLFEAEVAQDRLKAEGIPCFLTDTAMVGLGLPNVVGGTGLQVPAEHAAHARALLVEAPTADVDRTSEEPESITEAERNARRAWRAALLGVVFWPLEWYAIWLLVKVGLSDDTLRPGLRWRALVAAVVSGVFGVILPGYLFISILQ